MWAETATAPVRSAATVSAVIRRHMAGFSFRTFRSRNQPRRFPDEHVSLDTPRRRTISAAMAFARRTWIATALAALALAGPAQSAAAPYREYEIGFSGEASPLGKSPSEAELINAVAWIMSNKLGLPFPAGTKAYIYVNQATLVDGLIQIAGEKREEAWDKGRFATGVATRVGLFLRGDHLAQMHLLGRAGLFAHELTHVSQRKLADGGRGPASPWIPEGHP